MRIHPTYFDKKTLVEVGDHIETRIFFKKHKGRVVYVPGVSPPNERFQQEGFERIGIDLENGPFLAEMVDPYEGWVGKGIKFIKRDPSYVPTIRELEKDFDEFDEKRGQKRGQVWSFIIHNVINNCV